MSDTLKSVISLLALCVSLSAVAIAIGSKNSANKAEMRLVLHKCSSSGGELVKLQEGYVCIPKKEVGGEH